MWQRQEINPKVQSYTLRLPTLWRDTDVKTLPFQVEAQEELLKKVIATVFDQAASFLKRLRLSE